LCFGCNYYIVVFYFLFLFTTMKGWMKVLHTQDQSWCDENLNDNAPSFCNTIMTRWGTYWRYELQITQVLPKNVVRLHPKHGLINNVSIAISSALWKNPTIDNKISRVCNTCIKKLVYAPRGHFMKVGNLIIYIISI
jgi:hypothetical protein